MVNECLEHGLFLIRMQARGPAVAYVREFLVGLEAEQLAELVRPPEGVRRIDRIAGDDVQPPDTVVDHFAGLRETGQRDVRHGFIFPALRDVGQPTGDAQRLAGSVEGRHDAAAYPAVAAIRGGDPALHVGPAAFKPATPGAAQCLQYGLAVIRVQSARPAIEAVRKVGFRVEAQHVSHAVGPPDTRLIGRLAHFTELGLRGRQIAFQLLNLLFGDVQTLFQAIQRIGQRTQQRTLSCATTGRRCVAVATQCVVCNCLDFSTQVRSEKAIQDIFIPPFCARLWRTCREANSLPCRFMLGGRRGRIPEAFIHAAGMRIAQGK